MFRFIHTAYWQIAKLFADITTETQAAHCAERIDAVRTMAQLAARNKVDAVSVVGDVFDSNTDRTSSLV